MKTVVILVFAAQTVLGATSENWTRRAEIGHPIGNLSFSTPWRPATGLHLKITSQDSLRSVIIVLRRDEGDIALSPEKAFRSAVVKSSQFDTGALPTNELSSALVVLKFRPETWVVYIENNPVAVVPTPFLPPAVLFQPASEMQDGHREKDRFQKIADFRFRDDFLVPEGETNQLAAWQIQSGSWFLHTAQENPGITRKGLKAALSPNFYSLLGKGTNAVITAGHEFYDSHVLGAAVQVAPGEMGLVFCFNGLRRYHAFTLQTEASSHKVRLNLWRTRPANDGGREVLGAVSLELTHGQWVKLRARTFQDRVQCYMDNVKVMDIPVALPVGGKFGLYADSKDGVRFDGVSARSHHDLDFRDVGELRRYTLVEKGKFFPRRRLLGVLPSRDTGAFLEPPESKRPQWLIVGSPVHGAHVFSADFHPSADSYSVGLLTGFTGADQPVFRFTFQKSPTNELFLLEHIATNVSTVLETLELPVVAEKKARRHVRLMCDATNGGELRMYRNGALVLIHHPESEPRGASGLYVGPRTGVRISNPEYRFERGDLYRNQFEKNRTFMDDPFMRHWSSPEGEWIADKDNLVWYKGDFFGRFLVRLPFIKGSEVHLGVDEGNVNGLMVVKAGEKGLVLVEGNRGSTKEHSLAGAPIDDLAIVERAAKEGGKKTQERWYSMHHEGYWLWLTSGDKVLFKRRLKRPFKGRRMRIAGFTTAQLKHSYVERFNVKDCLFTESLHDWIVNGGRWEVINRFLCQPRWSHMNGESRDNMAALWSKHSFRGDFCIELYAGTRHGWYDRCGDFNITAMNRGTTPSRGYTITCTGWDFDHSQRFTKFYRNGRILDRSDKYLVPRRRDGNKRRRRNPLVAGGRDVHGAWYYAKFRRTGKKLEYHFDNELVFSCEDSDPLEQGSVGVWTFMNSIMVARVKIAAEHIEPRRFDFTPLSPEADVPPARPPKRRWTKYADIRKNGDPLELNIPPNWRVDDKVGHSVLSWHEVANAGPCFVVRNVLGSGAMLARCELPPVPYQEIAGWRFHIKRTPGAQFNFHYSFGRLDKNGKYVAARSFFHRISGTDFSKGTYKMGGRAKVAATAWTSGNWHAEQGWTPVEVWLPTEGVKDLGVDAGLLVRIEGFGNLRPSYVLQGLSGNGPGEAYAVRSFSEIRYATPKVALSAGASAPLSFSIQDPESGAEPVTCTDIMELQTEIDKFSRCGLVRARLQVVRTNAVSCSDLVWIRLPEKINMSCSWSAERANAIELRSDALYPDRRFLFAKMSVRDIDIPLAEKGLNRRVGLLPRIDQLCGNRTNSIPVTVTAAGTTRSFSLTLKDNPGQEPPVLLGIRGVTPFFQNFEQRQLAGPLNVNKQTMGLGHFDSRQGSYLRVFNAGKARRLKSVFTVPVDLSRYPLFQFRYRATEMTHVTMALRASYYVKLAENYDRVRPVRRSKDLGLDGEWHTWLGTVSDAVTELPFSTDLLAARTMALGSFHAVDQTGLFTEWHLDDLMFGPAISDGRQLAFTPDYFSFDGVDGVHIALRSGPEGYDELDEKQIKSLAWASVTNRKETVPDLSGLSDGLCRIYIKARDRRGNESRVTDIPFLLDRQPAEVSCSFEKTDDPVANGSLLRVSCETGGHAPLDLSAVKIRWDDTEVPVGTLRSRFIHSPGNDSMVLNWPHIFRDQLNQAENGQTFKIVIANIRDGAGNRSPNISISRTIEYEKDHMGPTLLSVEYPKSVLWCTGWEAASHSSLHFRAENGCQTALVRDPANGPYLRMQTKDNAGGIQKSFDKQKWLVSDYPYLAFRIRRPNMLPDEKTRIDVAVQLDGKHKYVLSLTHPEQGQDLINLSEPIPWRSNAWHTVMVDLGRLLAGRPKPENMEKLQIRALRFQQSDATNELSLHLQSVFVFSRWSGKDQVTIDAYDGSGVQGTAWEYVKTGGTPTTHATALTPALLRAQDQGSGWVVMRAVDKAGNVSVPIRIPAYNGPAEKTVRLKRSNISHLLDSLKSDSFEELKTVFEALEKIGSAGHEAIPRLIKLLEHRDWKVGWGAVGVLAKIGPAAVSSLTRMLETGPVPARWRAASALGEIGPAAKAAVPALEKAAKSGHRTLKEKADEALKKIQQ